MALAVPGILQCTKISCLRHRSAPQSTLLSSSPQSRPSPATASSQGYSAIAGAALALAGALCRAQARHRSSTCSVQTGRASKVELHAAASSVEPDRLVRYLGGNVSVRAMCATDMVRDICSMHNCSPVTSMALGRAVMAAALLANGRDEGETLQLRIQGDGPIGSVITEASAALTCRGMVGNPAADAATVPELIGTGKNSTLRVTRTHPYWKRPYTGTTILKCGEIAEDVVHYLAMSEQTPASMGLSVEWDEDAACVKHAEGWLVTLLPGWEEGEIGAVETNIKTFARMEPSVASRPDAICQHMMRELRGTFQAEQKPTFRCKCSKSRLASAVMMLGKQEVLGILEKKEPVEAKCEWCGTTRSLTPGEIEEHLQSDEGQQQMETRSASPRQMKLKEDELKPAPEKGEADWS
eukprot:TRINITY_DN32827_c0_g1_i1.p1 TRINITY_DN32827_c0_g1~~TRINITY_DN32827_c0_g1_i1.p1  ORF type:complete len:421 (-),score=71.44 TRINITY_DN32827_c0_g1_i1:468-1700(-)